MSTAYHARYFAHELTRIGATGVERLSQSLFDACVDLNPHQIDAALFALRSPLNKGVLLADEVGLGKTIEAGLVVCQFWAEKRRRILVICPASLRKQWELELREKFNLQTSVLDAKSYNAALRNGNPSPLMDDCVIVCSMHFAAQHAGEVRAVPWDLVVIDEAHKLRNAHRESNQIGQKLRWAIGDRRKILLTATPLQNSLLELYGISTILDDHLFGDLPSFRTQYTGSDADLDGLRGRLRSFCTRTLRRQVLEYVRFTKRHLLPQPFTPTDHEHQLYEAVSTFLQRENTYAIPQQQKHLITLLVRKILASSAHALAATLQVMHDRLVKLKDDALKSAGVVERLLADQPIDDDLLDELLEDQEDTAEDETESPAQPDGPAKVDLPRLEAEIGELAGYIRWARGIGIDTKTRGLIRALQAGFDEMSNAPTEKKPSRKAVVFTESRQTQVYLRDFLEANGYAGQVVLFNGSNSDSDSIAIYDRWLEANQSNGRASGSRQVDMRMALVEHFRDNVTVLIATEAAAEGINLQFCSLVINFDLPWNPQRIEQRIGRCHRYGQQHDVVVINFLNSRNEADHRVHELLEHKFNLFTGIFGASDEVLGAIESGVDFERRIHAIYQTCRTPEQIANEFERLRAELDEQIQARMKEIRDKLLEHFDADVHARLKANLTGARERLDRLSELFWILTRFILDGRAAFDDQALSFDLRDTPLPAARPGTYRLISKTHQNVTGEFLYRLSHPLGEYVLHAGKTLPTPVAHVVFSSRSTSARISLIEQLRGKSGWMILQHLQIDSFDREEHLLFSAFTDGGQNVDQETCIKLFNCVGETGTSPEPDDGIRARLDCEAQRHRHATVARSLEENNKHFNEAREQLEMWAEDMEAAVQRELEDTKNRIKAMNRQARLATTMEEQAKLQDEIRDLEQKKRNLRQRIFDVEDEITEKRDALIGALERRMQQKTQTQTLFTISWKVQ